MLDVGWSEFLVIGVVALVIVGPKDLPVMFRTLGRFTAKARNMSREFTRAMEAAARESGVGDVAKDLKSVTSPRSLGLDAMQNAASRFEKWDPLKKHTAVKPAVVKGPTGAGAEAVLVPDASVAANIGPNTAALAAERVEKCTAVIQSAEKRAAERAAEQAAEQAGAASTPATKKVKGTKAAKAGAEKPPVSAVAKAKAATKAAATAKPGAAPGGKPKPRPRTIAVAVETPAASPVKPSRKTASQKAPLPKTPARTGDA